jgi:hypothetical protein
MYTIKFECINCHKVAEEKVATKIEAEIVASLGGACIACCGKAQAYYGTAAYKEYEESEKDFRF